MIYKLLQQDFGFIEAKSRDDYIDKRVKSTGDLLFEMFEKSYRNVIK